VNYERNKKGARFFETQCSLKLKLLHVAMRDSGYGGRWPYPIFLPRPKLHWGLQWWRNCGCIWSCAKVV